jgi:hypothetical protein
MTIVIKGAIPPAITEDKIAGRRIRKRWRADSKENSCLKEPVPGEGGDGGGVVGESSETGSGFSMVSTLDNVWISID